MARGRDLLNRYMVEDQDARDLMSATRLGVANAPGRAALLQTVVGGSMGLAGQKGEQDFRREGMDQNAQVERDRLAFAREQAQADREQRREMMQVEMMGKASPEMLASEAFDPVFDRAMGPAPSARGQSPQQPQASPPPSAAAGQALPIPEPPQMPGTQATASQAGQSKYFKNPGRKALLDVVMADYAQKASGESDPETKRYYMNAASVLAGGGTELDVAKIPKPAILTQIEGQQRDKTMRESGLKISGGDQAGIAGIVKQSVARHKGDFWAKNKSTHVNEVVGDPQFGPWLVSAAKRLAQQGVPNEEIPVKLSDMAWNATSQSGISGDRLESVYRFPGATLIPAVDKAIVDDLAGMVKQAVYDQASAVVPSMAEDLENVRAGRQAMQAGPSPQAYGAQSQ